MGTQRKTTIQHVSQTVVRKKMQVTHVTGVFHGTVGK